ncbi:hypothetical protein [Rouxiella badensis]|uniref:hypothetical protein n=1 Tax=Rouxiella badensis TaxID=1646377 RepID=UPI001CE3C2E9|nr:hypothetical protein [Rouxiella badensis]
MSQNSIVDVKAWIDSRSISGYQWLILSLCFIIIMFDGYDAAVMGFIAPALMDDWGMGRGAMGQSRRGHVCVAIGALVPVLMPTVRKKTHSADFHPVLCGV